MKSGHTLPQPYTGATYTILPTSTTNTTHWQLDVLCSGCSQWQGLSLNPNGPNTFAWAKGSRAVTTPSSNTSAFAYHDDKGVFSHDLSLGKIPKDIFDALVYDAGHTGKPSSSSTAVSSTASTPSVPVIVPTTSRPTVITSVTFLSPRPSTSKPSITGTVTSAPTTIITRPTTSFTWSPDQPLTTQSVTTKTTVVVPPKPSTTTVVAPSWVPPFGRPPFGRPPWRGPPWRRPPGVGEEGGADVHG